MPNKDRFNRVYAGESQIRAAKADKQALERMLRQDKTRKEPKISDEGLVRQEIEEKRKIIEDYAPKKLTGEASNRAYTEAKKLKAEIKAAMPSNKAYYQQYPKGSSHKKERDFEDAVRQQVAFQTDKKLKMKVKRFRAMMAELDPSDPRVRNIENLRR